ncbi:MAG: hypothetical protein ACD_60C00090G0014 [uncultured bacterium]|nr:MAG: hypothetical protein ACD_60C00090G0014 [uncultured bacterium]
MTIEKLAILQLTLPIKLHRYFDYLAPIHCDTRLLKPGIRIRVPFQHRELIGILLGVSETSSLPREKLKSAVEMIDDAPVISSEILKLCQWASDYYHYPLGEVLSAVLPKWLRQGKPTTLKRMTLFSVNERSSAPLVLNDAQQKALSAIQSSLNAFQVFLLEGVTGSGKTEVYLQAIANVLERRQQVLVLVPEIGLTPQTLARFQERFPVPIATLHSGMTEKQRFQTWLHAKSGKVPIVIGTRSAVFTPFENLGLIIIDEEHDLSFKQQDTFRYHARDVAIMRAHFNDIPIVLGSATPSLETLHNAKQNRYQSLYLPERAGVAKLPNFQIIDTRHQSLEQGLSHSLLKTIQHHLDKDEQVMLFLNRRGFAPVLICQACGWMAMCKRCDARMTYHYKAMRLHCHHCDAQKNILTSCEKCGADNLEALGQGTERLEQVLKKHFPHYSIARIDRDSTRRKGSMENVLTEIQERKHQILIGTQMLAKGHHFPHVTLVGILDIDGGFFSTDFRAIERMGQLLLQVAGRSGRDEKEGTVMIQTYHPDHPLLHQLLHENYQKFSTSLLNERKMADLPPYTFFALFRAEAHKADRAEDFLQQVKKQIEKNNAVQIMGPLAAPMPRKAGMHRVQLLLQAKKRTYLQDILKNLLPQIETISLKQRVRWSLDVDPLEMF